MNFEDFVAIDFETADQGRDSACSVGLVRVQAGKITQTVIQLIRPPRQTFIFTEVHRLRWQDVKDKPEFKNVYPIIQRFISPVDQLYAHWASFDQAVMNSCCIASKLEPPKQPWGCTVELAKMTWGLRHAKLPQVCELLKIELNHHEALSDATACAKIVLAVGAELANRRGLPL